MFDLFFSLFRFISFFILSPDSYHFSHENFVGNFPVEKMENYSIQLKNIAAVLKVMKSFMLCKIMS